MNKRLKIDLKLDYYVIVQLTEHALLVLSYHVLITENK